MSDLSSRFSARAATPADAPGMLAVEIARDIADLGYPDYALEDVHEEMEHASDACVVLDGDAVVAYALLDRGDAHVAVHPDACGNGIGTWLLRWTEQRGAYSQAVSGSNDAARRLLAEAGYAATQHYWRMTLDLDEPVVPPAWPEGLEVRAYRPDERTAAKALIDHAFRSVPGYVGRDWRDRYATELSTMVLSGDTLVGVALCERWDDEGKGYVSYLAVHDDWRGRGLGRALLGQSLAQIRAAGLRTANLGVNGANESATRLYESVGMSVESHSDRYERRIT
jgi:mycothiol synthase